MTFTESSTLSKDTSLMMTLRQHVMTAIVVDCGTMKKPIDMKTDSMNHIRKNFFRKRFALELEGAR